MSFCKRHAILSSTVGRTCAAPAEGASVPDSVPITILGMAVVCVAVGARVSVGVGGGGFGNATAPTKHVAVVVARTNPGGGGGGGGGGWVSLGGRRRRRSAVLRSRHNGAAGVGAGPPGAASTTTITTAALASSNRDSLLQDRVQVTRCRSGARNADHIHDMHGKRGAIAVAASAATMPASSADDAATDEEGPRPYVQSQHFLQLKPLGYSLSTSDVLRNQTSVGPMCRSRSSLRIPPAR